MIDEKFIKTWDPGNSHNAYEIEYEDILKSVEAEKNSKEKSIKLLTFKRLYKWKTRNRSYHLIQTRKYEILYQKAFNDVITKLDDDKKIEILYKKENKPALLPGIRFAVASTILHFLFPKRFPIIDVRTISTLWDKGYLREFKSKESIKENLDGYLAYKKLILRIRDTYENITVRQIDRALFTYNEMKEKLIKIIKISKTLSLDDVKKTLNISNKKIISLISDLTEEFNENLRRLNDLKIKFT